MDPREVADRFHLAIAELAAHLSGALSGLPCVIYGLVSVSVGLISSEIQIVTNSGLACYLTPPVESTPDSEHTAPKS